MQQSKYVQLLRTLSKSERTEFGKYLKGLYGAQKKLLNVYNYIHSDATSNYESARLNKRYVLENKKSKLKSTANRLERHLSDLFFYLEEFLRWKKINRTSVDSFEKDKIQLGIYEERQLSDFFFKEIERVQKRIEGKPLDMWRHLELGSLDSFLHYSFETIKVSKKNIALPNFLKHLEQFIEEVKTKVLCELEQRKNILSKKDRVENTVDQEFLLVYQALLGLIKKEGQQTFEEVKTIVLAHLSKFGQEDSSGIITHLINYCIGQTKVGQLQYGKEIFELYRILIEQQKVFEGGYISHTDFNNIIEVACKIGEIKWIEQFVKQEEKLIYPIHLQQSSLAIGKALIYFTKKDYLEVISLLNVVTFTNMDHALRARWLLLTSHFELHPHSKQFEDAADAYYIFFKRNVLWHKDTIEGSLNLLRFLRKMTKAYDKEELKKEILETSPLIYKLWLIKKLDPDFQL